jgi:hypothetical protein
VSEGHSRFDEARVALDRGDVEALDDLLAAEPDLVHARAMSSEPPYNGYFWRATLLHHVAGNPIRGPLPETIVEVARVLIQHGADVNARCGGGPDQPETAGGTVLGLLVSGAQAERQGLTTALMGALLSAGAHVDPAGDGGLLWISLYHTVEHRGQRNVARSLHDHGHPVDLCYAAGVGRADVVRQYLDAPVLPEDADRFYRHHRSTGPEATAVEVLADTLLFAAVTGREAIASQLLARSDVQVDRIRPWGSQRVTPLHGAAWAGWPGMVRLLLDHGADPGQRDPVHDGTPRDWAAHCGNDEILPLL